MTRRTCVGAGALILVCLGACGGAPARDAGSIDSVDASLTDASTRDGSSVPDSGSDPLADGGSGPGADGGSRPGADSAVLDAGAALTDQAEFLVTVRTPDWNTPTGTLQRFARTNSQWVQEGPSIPIILGRNGLAWGQGLHGRTALTGLGGTMKREGDGRSPAGAFTIGPSFGYAATPPTGTMASYQAMTPTLQCIEDTSSAFYNQIVDRALVTPDWSSTDRLLRMDGLYEFIVFVEHNTAPAMAGGGSCILLHVWSDNGTRATAGCTSMARDNLQSVVQSLHAQGNMLVQLPDDAYRALAPQWNLPSM